MKYNQYDSVARPQLVQRPQLVHPTRARYFNPHNPEELSEIILELGGNFSQELEAQCMSRAELEFPARRLAFAQQYEKIVCSVVNGGYSV